MYVATRFEVDIILCQIAFPHTGFLGDFVDAQKTYDYDTWLENFVECRVFPEDRAMVRKTFQKENIIQAGESLSCEFCLLNTENGEYERVSMQSELSQDRQRATGFIERLPASGPASGPVKRKKEPLGKWFQKNHHQATIFVAGGILLLVALIISMVVYTRNLYLLVNEESQGYLEEIATQVNGALVKGMNHHYAVLESIGTKMEQVADWPEQKIFEDLDNEAAIFDYQQIALVDEQGNWLTGKGSLTVPELFPYISELKSKGEPVTSEVIPLAGEDGVAFLYPIENMRLGNRKIIGIGAMADMDMLTNMLYVTLFDGAGYSHVVGKNGNVIIRSTHEDNTFQSYSLFKYLEGATFDDNMTVETVSEDFEKGNTRKIHYTIDGQDLLAIYAPVGYSDWYLFTVIPSDVLTAKTNSFFRLTILTCVGISALFILLFTAIFILQAKSRRQLMTQLYTDPVTGGRSKVKFEIDSKALIRRPGASLCMLYANVQRFKLVNDRDGSKAGDQLLAAIYQIFDKSLGKDEAAARLMADHYGVLVASQDIPSIQERIEEWNRQVKEYTAANLLTSASLEYGVYPIMDKDADIALILDRANLARKAFGRNNSFGLYDSRLSEKLRFEAELESRQEKALENNEFTVYYQPKYTPQTDAVVGAEALIRWITPDSGMLRPDKYISLFESNGFIQKLDLFVFDQVCAFIRKMQDEGQKPIPVSVNLSRAYLNKPDFFQNYLDIWSRYDIDASLLEFEITESLIYENKEHLNQLLEKIHSYGFMVSMDDFGSGYSSLNMLKDINIDIVKLDREFFNQKEADEKAKTIVKRLIELSRDLGMPVVAEGIETQEMCNFLKSLRCDMIQGYYYSPPVPLEGLMGQMAGAGKKKTDNEGEKK